MKEINTNPEETINYDLHSHTHWSDGELSPTALVQRAHAQGVDYLAITDHDTLAGLSEAQQAAADLPLRVINGVEITCAWQAYEIHILGLNVATDNAVLTELLAEQQERRYARFETMLDKLTAAGVPIRDHLPEVTGMPTRKHIADALVAMGQIRQFGDAFQRYIGAGQFAYTKANWCAISEAVAAIHAAGGMAVLAHPHAYQLSNKWLRRLLTDAQSDGLDGLEVAVGQQSPGQREALAGFADDFTLLASAGSDFHGPRPWRELGRNLTLPASCQPVWSAWTPQNLMMDHV